MEIAPKLSEMGFPRRALDSLNQDAPRDFFEGLRLNGCLPGMVDPPPPKDDPR
jgi:hypothetical protein